LKYFASGQSRSRSRNFIAKSGLRKSAMSRECSPVLVRSSALVSRRCRRVVKRSKVTAVSRTFEFQKPNAACRIASGVGRGFHHARCSESLRSDSGRYFLGASGLARSKNHNRGCFNPFAPKNFASLRARS